MNQMKRNGSISVGRFGYAADVQSPIGDTRHVWGEFQNTRV